MMLSGTFLPRLIKSFLLHPQGNTKLIYPPPCPPPPLPPHLPVFLLMNNQLLKRIKNGEKIHSYEITTALYEVPVPSNCTP